MLRKNSQNDVILVLSTIVLLINKSAVCVAVASSSLLGIFIHILIQMLYKESFK